MSITDIIFEYIYLLQFASYQRMKRHYSCTNTLAQKRFAKSHHMLFQNLVNTPDLIMACILSYVMGCLPVAFNICIIHSTLVNLFRFTQNIIAYLMMCGIFFVWQAIHKSICFPSFPVLVSSKQSFTSYFQKLMWLAKTENITL